jgi:hypothetical protein
MLAGEVSFSKRPGPARSHFSHIRMLQRSATTESLIEVLDHVLDKGIVIDAWVSLSLIGISMVT